jgi:hypothetical protein
MAQVDPEDDSIRRFLVRHYRYDPQRHERRQVVVAAFDNEREMLAGIGEIGAEIRRRREAGEEVGRGEHASGVIHQPGYLRQAAIGHLVRRAVSHGVFPRVLRAVELPPGMSVIRAEPPAAR